ncbi:MAG: SDR family oxidoreductase [Pseudomonadota bacterium]|nr:SDR family oxidoreductase [Pseudomonadota bacterium]
MSVAGKSIIVTGAASGIGRALALGFAADGARVLAVDINGDDLAGVQAPGLETRVVDVTDLAQVEAMVARAVEAFGRLDVLFNNAGLGYRVGVTDHAPDQFERLVRVNLFGPYYGIRAAIPVMRAQGGGHIVSTHSRAAEAGMANFSAYASSKAGLFALTRAAARETLGTGVRINGLIPGPTRSGMMKNAEQAPESVYPTARWLAEMGNDGPTGKVFWNQKEYRLFEEGNGAFRREIA